GFYEHIEHLYEQLCGGLRRIFHQHRIVAAVQGLGARFGIYFGIPEEQKVTSYADAQRHDRAMLLRFYAAAIKHGVYFHDYGAAPCHHGFCAAMQMADVEEALARLDRALAELH